LESNPIPREVLGEDLRSILLRIFDPITGDALHVQCNHEIRGICITSNPIAS
jgi:hypothetical protein